LDEAEVIHRVKVALTGFFEKDHELLHVDASERSISHKLAEQLQGQFPEFNVDCEYNRHRDDVKRLNFYDDEAVSPKDTEARTVFPDIVIHERGHDEKNLLVVEIKKSTNRNRNKDIEKLKAFTDNGLPEEDRFGYETGLFIEFDVEYKVISGIKVFKNGREELNSPWAEGVGHGG
jgi:hypothetical protein